MDQLVNPMTDAPHRVPTPDAGPALPSTTDQTAVHEIAVHEIAVHKIAVHKIAVHKIEGPAAEPIIPAGQGTRPIVKRAIAIAGGLVVVLLALRRRRD